MILGLIMTFSLLRAPFLEQRDREDESLLRSRAHQCPERHQGSDGNVLVIYQLFLSQRERFHN
jgi:hypothetical protein